jgi:hypothetical protein
MRNNDTAENIEVGKFNVGTRGQSAFLKLRFDRDLNGLQVAGAKGEKCGVEISFDAI